MPTSAEEMIQFLLKTNKEQEETIEDLRATVKDLQATIANLNKSLDEFKRKFFGISNEKTGSPDPISRIRRMRACQRRCQEQPQ